MPTKITKVSDRTRFENIHKNYKLPYSHKVILKGNSEVKWDQSYKDSTQEIQKLIKMALSSQIELRPFGSKWSLSKAPYSKDALVDYSDLKLKRFLTRSNLSVDFKSKTKKYLFAQCGNLIEDLSLYLEDNGRSLMTSGASNGQTIAGAIGTGVHGSAYKVGAIQDSIVALHIVNSDNESLFIQHSSTVVADQSFIDLIGAKSVVDDDLFSSALVSFGAFGFVHGVVIETVPLYLLKNYVLPIQKDFAFKMAKTLGFKLLNQNLGESTDPYHFKLYINQYDMDHKEGIRGEVIYAYGFKRDRDIGFIKSILSYFKDIPKILGKFTDNANCTIPALIKLFRNSVLPKSGIELGHLNDIFHKTKIRGSAFSTAFAVPVDRSVDAYNLMYKIIEDTGKNIPSIFSMRFVKKSKALMAFTKFPMSCVMGIDGLQSDSTDEYLTELHKALEESDIPYAFHWGKVNNLTPEIVEKCMGTATISKWKENREKILSPELMKVFNNDFIRKVGLDK